MFKVTISKALTPDIMQAQVAFWQDMLAAWERCELLPDDDVTTVVFKLYFRMQNVVDVHKELKQLGIGNFRTSTEVTETIMYGHIEDEKLEKLTKMIQNKNHTFSLSIH